MSEDIQTHLLTLYQRGDHPAVEALARRLTLAAPQEPFFWKILGAALHSLGGRGEELLAVWLRAAQLRPGDPEAQANLAIAWKDLGRMAEAEACLRRALTLQPDFLPAWYNLGNLLRDAGRFQEAETAYRTLLDLCPDHVDALCNLGLMLIARQRPDEAEACFARAVAIAPQQPALLVQLGKLLAGRNGIEEAAGLFQRALALDPECVEARWHLAFLALSPFRHAEGAGQAARGRFGRELEDLAQWSAARGWRDGPRGVGCEYPFHLAYDQEENRELLTRHGRLCARLMEGWREREGIPSPPALSAPPLRLRVGVVSRYWRDHSVWHALIQGWFARLDPARCELLAFDLAASGDVRSQVERIQTARPDLLIYPEVGMDAMTVRLAALRLAPLQLASWGHPETTGLPTMDGFLSAELFEPANGADCYSEKLVKLPNLGSWFTRMTGPGRADARPEGFGLDPARPVLVSPGTPYKYHPDHDAVFVQLARRIDGCQLVLFDLPGYRHLCHYRNTRLQDRFRREGLEWARHVTILPWLTEASFHDLLRVATLMVDTIGFSGFNTVVRALECHLPVVTLEGRFLRGRLGAGVLRRLGMPELIAADVEGYVALASRLAGDASFRESMRTRIAARLPILFEDPAPVTALEELMGRGIR
ncbi:MAG: tetratricopeptide repeat protein [Magnetococcales bacterium]|nr:tetratricopeptide repeat protein [Magnetococcales bacterium]